MHLKKNPSLNIKNLSNNFFNERQTKTPNVNILIGISLVQAEKSIVMEEKSPNPPPINLWLLEARAHHINRGPGLWNELGKGKQ